MEFEISWIESSLASVRTSGLASAEGFTALYEQLAAQPGFGPGVKMLSDHTDLDVSALVVGHRSPAKYGLARMFEALAAEEPGDLVRVVETSDDALAWLRGEDAKPLPPASRRAEP